MIIFWNNNNLNWFCYYFGSKDLFLYVFVCQKSVLSISIVFYMNSILKVWSRRFVPCRINCPQSNCVSNIINFIFLESYESLKENKLDIIKKHSLSMEIFTFRNKKYMIFWIVFNSFSIPLHVFFHFCPFYIIFLSISKEVDLCLQYPPT